MHDFGIYVSELVRECCPDLRLGCLIASVEVSEETPELWAAADRAMEEIAATLSVDQVSSKPTISATRKGYKALGKDPARYRPSAEALLRRITTGKGLYRVNNVVDLINWVSAESGFSIGGYDLHKINGTILLDKGGVGVPYEAIGRGELNIENLPVLHDQTGPFGSPTSDSMRTNIGLDAKTVVWVVFDFDGNGPLEDVLNRAEYLLTAYASGQHFRRIVIRK